MKRPLGLQITLLACLATVLLPGCGEDKKTITWEHIVKQSITVEDKREGTEAETPHRAGLPAPSES